MTKLFTTYSFGLSYYERFFMHRDSAISAGFNVFFSEIGIADVLSLCWGFLRVASGTCLFGSKLRLTRTVLTPGIAVLLSKLLSFLLASNSFYKPSRFASAFCNNEQLNARVLFRSVIKIVSCTCAAVCCFFVHGFQVWYLQFRKTFLRLVCWLSLPVFFQCKYCVDNVSSGVYCRIM